MFDKGILYQLFGFHSVGVSREPFRGKTRNEPKSWRIKGKQRRLWFFSVCCNVLGGGEVATFWLNSRRIRVVQRHVSKYWNWSNFQDTGNDFSRTGNRDAVCNRLNRFVRSPLSRGFFRFDSFPRKFRMDHVKGVKYDQQLFRNRILSSLFFSSSFFLSFFFSFQRLSRFSVTWNLVKSDELVNYDEVKVKILTSTQRVQDWSKLDLSEAVSINFIN